MDTPPSSLPDHQVENLWEIIKRFDFYISTTNYKTGLLITFNMAIFGAVLLKWKTLTDLVPPGVAQQVTNMILAGVALCSLASLLFVFLAGQPRLNSESTDEKKDYRSVIFMGSLHKNYPQPSEFTKEFSALSQSTFRDDLAQQAWELAGIASLKFRRIGVAFHFVTFGTIPLMAVLSLTVLFTTWKCI